MKETFIHSLLHSFQNSLNKYLGRMYGQFPGSLWSCAAEATSECPAGEFILETATENGHYLTPQTRHSSPSTGKMTAGQTALGWRRDTCASDEGLVSERLHTTS